MPFADPDANRKYQREWRARRRAAWFADKTCVRCGAVDALEMDHVDASLKVDHKVWGWNQERREAELAKCQVLCTPCHDEKTLDRQEHAFGERVGTSKLSLQQVLEARRLYAAGQHTFRQLGDQYGVHRDTIRYLVNRGGWRLATENLESSD